ncbi:MAG: hypothetical protein ACTSYU_02255 [Promethearchaeota archaeon]
MNVEQQFIPTNILKMSLACSRCKNLVSLTCDEHNKILIECNFYKYNDNYEEIAKITRVCPRYDEDFDILRKTLKIKSCK